ncbi:hypothetical protein LAZ67_2004312 [Cordylochernes scorpioides]|uniref:Uncharacterized protein n=1 Tax=Cordylochernes scorpioides TaxID=51811 RepID=A0ABY6K737_9ARAC|nr:hypothetical protein LAZ67_2004312 [Cordylochernes scorpioides]
MDSCKNKNKKASKPSQPSVNIAALVEEDNMVISRHYQILKFLGQPSPAALHLDLRTEIIKGLVRDVKNLAGTVNDFLDLEEIMDAQMPKKTCQTTQTDPAPICKDFSAQTEPIKPATPAPAAVPVAAPAPKNPDPAPTKRKQPEVSNSPAKRTKLLVPAKPASSRAPIPPLTHGTSSKLSALPTLCSKESGRLCAPGENCCCTPEVIPAVSSALNNKLQGLKVRGLRQFLPRICLFNVEAETADEDIFKAFLSTDALSQLPGDKSFRMAHRSPSRNGTCTALIELDLASYKIIGRRGRIIVDQMILNYEESVRVCYRCCGYGHNAESARYLYRDNWWRSWNIPSTPKPLEEAEDYKD